MALGAITPNQNQTTPAVQPANIVRQAGTSTTPASSLTSGSSESGGFFSMLLKPFKMVGDFFTWIFKSLLCCCFYGGRDLKADIALIKGIVEAKPENADDQQAVLKKLYDLSSAIQKDVVEAYVNDKMDDEGVNLDKPESVAAFKKDNAENITKWEKQITDFFSKKDMKANPVLILQSLADVQIKLEKEAKSESK